MQNAGTKRAGIETARTKARGIKTECTKKTECSKAVWTKPVSFAVCILLLGFAPCLQSHAQEAPAISDIEACQTVQSTITKASHLFMNRTNPARGESENQRYTVASATLTPTGLSFGLKYAKDLTIAYSDVAPTMDASRAYTNGRVWLFIQSNNWYIEFPSHSEGNASSGIASLVAIPNTKVNAQAKAMDAALTHFSVALYHLVDVAHAGQPVDCVALAPRVVAVAAPPAASSSATASAPKPSSGSVAAAAGSASSSPSATATESVPPIAEQVAAIEAFRKQTAAWRARTVKPAVSDAVTKKRLLAEDALDHKDYRAAISYYEAATRLDPTWAQGWYSAAVLDAEQQDYLRATFSMKHYLILLPKAPNVVAARNKALLWEAKAEEAIPKQPATTAPPKK